MGHLVVAEFEMGSENQFDVFLPHASECILGVKSRGLEMLSPDFVSNLETMQDNLSQATEELIKNDWFWTFNPECGWDMGQENNKAIAAIDWHTVSTEELDKIKVWLEAFGGKNVTHRKDYDNYEDFE